MEFTNLGTSKKPKICSLHMVSSNNARNVYEKEGKNAGHDMAIVGEPCNADAHAKIPALFMSMLCPRLRNMSSTVCASLIVVFA